MNYSRRHMLQTASCGFGYLALQALCGDTQVMAASEGLATQSPVIPARAKRVIFLCMSGGPAQLDTFDYKPQTGNKKHPGSVFRFRQHGDSGLWISELLPKTARHADKLCVINGREFMLSRFFNCTLATGCGNAPVWEPGSRTASAPRIRICPVSSA